MSVKQHIAKCKEIYEQNRKWIEVDPYGFSSTSFINHDKAMFEKFLNEYKRLKGRHNINAYIKNLDVFFKITFNSFIHGDMKKVEGLTMFWEDKQEVFDCLVGYFGSVAEAHRYFKSVDNVSSYT